LVFSFYYHPTKTFAVAPDQECPRQCRSRRRSRHPYCSRHRSGSHSWMFGAEGGSLEGTKFSPALASMTSSRARMSIYSTSPASSVARISLPAADQPSRLSVSTGTGLRPSQSLGHNMDAIADNLPLGCRDCRSLLYSSHPNTPTRKRFLLRHSSIRSGRCSLVSDSRSELQDRRRTTRRWAGSSSKSNPSGQMLSFCAKKDIDPSHCSLNTT
jgi:hypothetical protein